MGEVVMSSQWWKDAVKAAGKAAGKFAKEAGPPMGKAALHGAAFVLMAIIFKKAGFKPPKF